MRFEHFEYMRWAKTIGQHGEWKLTNSGMPDLRPEDLGIPVEQLTFATEGFDHPRQLAPLLAKRHSVPEECVFVTASASHANAMVLLALLDRGDDALVETPTYPALPLVAKLAGATVIPLPRTFENGFQVDAERLDALLTRTTKVVALTNLHNPSGVRLSDAALDRIEAAAARVGAMVYVDEVYLDLIAGAQSAFRPGTNRVAVGSATKAWGLGGIRIGWALAPPEFVARLIALNDLFVVNPPWPSVRIAHEVFRREPQLRARIARTIPPGRRLLDEFLAGPGKDALEWVPPHADSIIGFPRLRRAADASPFLARLLADRGVNLTPGRFFGAPRHFRIAFSRPEAVIGEALARLAPALAELDAGN